MDRHQAGDEAFLDLTKAQTKNPGGLDQIAQPLALVGSRVTDQKSGTGKNPWTVPGFFEIGDLLKTWNCQLNC